MTNPLAKTETGPAALMLALLQDRRLCPLLLAQALGALNYNLLRAAIAVSLVFGAGVEASGGVTLIAAIVYVAPLFLFSGLAGSWADSRDKSALVRQVKAAEIALMLAGALALALGSTWLMLLALFLTGVLTMALRPLKYGLLPELLEETELVSANALIHATGFVGVLLGALASVLVLLEPSGSLLIGGLALVVAVAGWLASRSIPGSAPAAPDLVTDVNLLRPTLELLRRTAERTPVLLSLLALAWFWFISGLYVAQMPLHGRELYGDDQAVETLIVSLFAGGVALGALLAAGFVGRYISLTPVPFAALAMALFSLDLGYVAEGLEGQAPAANGIAEFMALQGGTRLLVDVTLAAVAAGVFAVPLYTLVQARGEAAHVGRTFAASNLFNAVALVLSGVVGWIIVSTTGRLAPLFVISAIGSIIVAGVVVWRLPGHVVKGILRACLTLAYRVEVTGRDNIDKAGPRTLVVVNHTSFLDGALMMAFMTELPVFAVFTGTANLWWMKPFHSIASIFPIDPTNPMATKSLVAKVKEGRPCVIFPEGRLSVTGALMKVFPGPAYIADRADAAIVAVRIDGAEKSYFTRLKRGEVHRRYFPKIRITVLEPTRLGLPDLRGKARRELGSQKLYDIMSDMLFRTTRLGASLFEALLNARDKHGADLVIVGDFQGAKLSYNRLITASLLLGSRFAAETKFGERVGVLLPNSAGTAVTFFGLQAFGRVAAMLNFSTGIANMEAATVAAEINVIISSRAFIDQAKLEPVVEALGAHARFVWLEDLHDDIQFSDKMKAVLDARLARRRHKALGITENDPAVVLFTSGTEGKPKGVVLSHGNLLANCRQASARVDYNQLDKCFDALPLFHSFGLTASFLMPTMYGVCVFLYPSPLHYKMVPEMVYDSNSTLIFGTNSFLKGYARKADPYDFRSVRYVFAGAEAIQDETRDLFFDKFGLRILAGYGATETSPVLTLNTPMHFRGGSVGRFLPNIEWKLETIPGLERGGRLQVKGPNVMLGYLLYDRPGVIDPPEGGWYDTGDIVDVDAEGYVWILGRAKRFAKIAGEMVSLSAAEMLASAASPDHAHAVVSLPDQRKGEKLILVTDDRELDRQAVRDVARQKGISDLVVPAEIIVVDEIPLLGSGKVDYTTTQKLVEDRQNTSEPT